MRRSKNGPFVGIRAPWDLLDPVPTPEPEREEEKPGTERKPG
jgi:hypothetical protein